MKRRKCLKRVTRELASLPVLREDGVMVGSQQIKAGWIVARCLNCGRCPPPMQATALMRRSLSGHHHR